jgi:hypothetical protein
VPHESSAKGALARAKTECTLGNLLGRVQLKVKLSKNGKTVYIHIFSHDYTRRNAMLSDAEYVHCIFFFLFPLIIDFFFEVYALMHQRKNGNNVKHYVSGLERVTCHNCIDIGAHLISVFYEANDGAPS